MDASEFKDTNERMFALTDPDPDPTGEFDETLEELMAEFLQELRGKNPLTIDEFAKRHPDQAGQIRELFPTLTAMERLKIRREHSSDGHISLGPRTPERLGDYRIIREIGRGGMGVVFEAEQESLDRLVAIKVIPGGLLLDNQAVQRFEQEARTAAGLHHSNIVPVFGVGDDHGMHYYVMQLIKGSGLDHCMTDEHGNAAFDARRVAELGLQAAEAISYAHDQGVLHRDIKPANLLLDETGNLWITDFGLARSLEATQTASQSSGGTLRYMPPERFQGVSTKEGDVYSLGITLLELLAGKPAFTATTPQQLIHQITNLSSLSVRNLDRALHQSLPRDLRTIIEKACEGRAADRYESAGEMAADLRRFLEGRPIQARRVSAAERMWRWCRRNPMLATALSVAVISSLSVAVVASIASKQTGELNEDLTEALDDARDKNDLAESERRAALNAALGEREQRELAEATSRLAIQAMNQVFDHFAPPGSLISTVQTQIEVTPTTADSTESGSEGAGGAAEFITLEAPALSPHVAQALSDLLPFYNKLAASAGEDPELRYYAAMAQYRVGLIHAQLGRFEEASAAYQESVASLRTMLSDVTNQPPPESDGSAPPSADQIRLSLARVLNDTAQSLRFSPVKSINLTTALREAMQFLQADPPHDLEHEWRLERARTKLILSTSGSLSRMAVMELQPTRGRGPGDRRSRMPGGIAPSQLENIAAAVFPGESEGPRLSWDQTIGLLNDAIDELQAVKADDPANENMRYLMACCLRERARSNAFRRNARYSTPSPAMESSIKSDREEARRLLEDLVGEFPSRTLYLLELSDTCNREAMMVLADRESAPSMLERLLRSRVGRALSSENVSSQESEAEALLTEAVEYSRQLVEGHPNELAITLGHVKNLYGLSERLRRRGESSDAESLLQEARSRQRGLHEAFPDSDVIILWDSRVTCALSDSLVASDRPEEALSLLSELLLILATYEETFEETPADGDPDDPDNATQQGNQRSARPLIDLAISQCWERMSRLNRVYGDPEQAAEFEELAQRSRERGQKLIDQRWRGMGRFGDGVRGGSGGRPDFNRNR